MSMIGRAELRREGGESRWGTSAWSGCQVVRRCDVLCRRCVCLAVPRRLWRPVGVRWVFDSCGAVTGVRCPAACLSALCVCENVSVSWWLVRHRYMSRRIVRVAVRTLCPDPSVPAPCTLRCPSSPTLQSVQSAESSSVPTHPSPAVAPSPTARGDMCRITRKNKSNKSQDARCDRACEKIGVASVRRE